MLADSADDGDRVAIYTRNLNDVTARLPEVVDAVRALNARALILDGEVIALASDGRPLSFQDTPAASRCASHGVGPTRASTRHHHDCAGTASARRPRHPETCLIDYRIASCCYSIIDYR
jgi:hypothetical protein